MCSHEIPADPVSRGINPEETIRDDLWWNGPRWLKTEEFPRSLSLVETFEELKKASNKNYQSS